MTALALATSACATVTRGNSEDVTFTSAPPGAKLETSIGLTCTTPCTLDIKRKQAFTAVFRHGRDSRTIRVHSRVAGAGIATGAGNVIIGGLIGVAVDASTGATLDHLPNPVHADFSRPQSQAQAAAEANARAITKASAKEHAETRKAAKPGRSPNS
ncbi:translation initiation factor 2 [Roseovarius spongiae]|uniref:Translation initiation factor 2 n=2 Tax=Roseovarius spongiae TaxID=2320272 RepID=A0A3A8AT21_9RHOB|nr:translation initiation factor 2 [Roseovarius spongiae]